MKYNIYSTLHAETEATIELPDGLTWDDLTDWYVKWDTLHYRVVGDKNWRRISLDSADDCVDWRTPTSVEVYPVDATRNIENLTDERIDN